MLYLPGLAPTAPAPGATQHMAPVVQANPDAGKHEVSSKISDVVAKVTTEFAISTFKAWLAPKESQW